MQLHSKTERDQTRLKTLDKMEQNLILKPK
jgi:hypothetical protein